MLISCRYRLNIKGKNICHSLTCPHSGKTVTNAECEGCVHTHPDDVEISKTAIPFPADLTLDKIKWKSEEGPKGPTGPSVPLSVPRPDLASIAMTLPVESPEKAAERTFKPPIFHDDGSIEYPKAEKDWEPPRDINGYVRDPNNKWLFHPLWPVCGLRYQMAFLKANCGCIDVIMRCNNPQSPEFGARLAHETCAKCPVRVK